MNKQPIRQWGRPWSLLDAPSSAQKVQPVQEPMKKSEPAAPAATKEPIQASWGCPVGLLGNYAPRRIDLSKYNGYQLAALKAGLDPETPNLEKMTFDQMKEMAHQKLLNEVVKPQRRAQGIPDPVERTRNYVIPCY